MSCVIGLEAILYFTLIFGILQMLNRTNNSGCEIKTNPETNKFKYITFHLLCYYTRDYSLPLHNKSRETLSACNQMQN